MITKTLFIEQRDDKGGIVEVWSPTDEEMLEMGFIRAPKPNGHNEPQNGEREEQAT